MLAPVHRTRLWLAGLALLALAALLATLAPDWFYGEDPLGLVATSLGWRHEAPPPVDVPLETFLPGQKRDLSAAQALAENLASPMERKNPAPPPFVPGWLSGDELGRASTCMAAAIYYEAAGEPEAGQLAVAQVILNRLRHPRFPKSVCEVVYQGSDRASGCQFTFTCDGSLARKPDAAGLAHARAVADLALKGLTSPLAGQATHYHTLWIVPVWAHEMRKVAIVGHHVFYRPPTAYGAYPALAGAAGPAPVPTGLPPMAPPPLAGGSAEAHGQPGVGAPPAPAHGNAVARAPAPVDGPGPALAQPPAASTLATGAASASHQRSFFGPPRRREGTLALPGTP